MLTSITKREPDIDTIWTTEHLLKNKQDLEAYLQLPDEVFTESIDIAPLLQTEEELADSGIVMVDTEDPICAAAGLFDMADFTMAAMFEADLFHRLLEKCSRYIYARTEKTSREFPGRLWRIYGSEYASEPFLPPNLYKEYVVRYTEPMVKMIQKYGGFARIHSHGRLRNILDDIANMGADAIDPVEAPPHGDIGLREVREKYGEQMVLFGNIQATDIENMPTDQFGDMVRRTLEEGTSGSGRGFVLMPTASPYGRVLSDLALKNYEKIIEIILSF